MPSSPAFAQSGETDFVAPVIPDLPVGMPEIAPTPPGVRQEYSRKSQFGRDWDDLGVCTVRGEDIKRVSVSPVDNGDPDRCEDDGIVYDPYNWNTVLASKVQIDHVVSLADAWRSGAYRWSQAQRHAFSQDQENHLAVLGRTNQQKSDDGPDQWSPPDSRGDCLYAQIYRGKKVEYHLTVTQSEYDGLARLLSSCH